MTDPTTGKLLWTPIVAFETKQIRDRFSARRSLRHCAARSRTRCRPRVPRSPRHEQQLHVRPTQGAGARRNLGWSRHLSTPQPVGDTVTPTTPERTNRPMARVPLDAPAAGPDDDDEVAVCEVVVTFFANHAAATKREETLTLEALATLIHSTTANAKEQLPWLKFARFGDTRTEKGSLRHNANVRAITGLEGDYDRGEMSLAEAKDRAARAAIAVIIYPSPSYTPERPKWRVLCPFSQEYPPAARDRFMARLSGLFDGIFSRESWTLSQSYFYGRVANPDHHATVFEGTPIDLADQLDEAAIGLPQRNIGQQAHPKTQPEDISGPRIRGIVNALLDNIRGAPDGKSTTPYAAIA